MKPWHQSDIARYREVQETIKNCYPGLHISEEYGLIFIRGCLLVKIPGIEKEIDNFLIEIIFPPDYPKRVPVVKEIGGRLPKIANRHFNTNETACLFFRDARHEYLPLDATFRYFMERIVINFFVWQIDYEATDGNPSMKGMAHNTAGVLEYYYRVTGIAKVSVVKKFLQYLCSKKIRPTWQCYCHSGKKIRDCHYKFIKDWQRKIISRRDIRISRAAVAQLPQNMR